MNFKPIFFTSDWHIGHEKCLTFDKRPFLSIGEMHKNLIRRYNSTVPEYGVCYFLGDIGNKVDEIKPVIDQLNGIKVLILGNHDKGMTSMYNAGFDVVLNSASLYIGDNKITLSHCPLFGIFREDTSSMKNPNENWHGEFKNHKFTLKNENQFHLHGHIHSRKDKPQSKKILDRQFDVGVVGNNYTPVSLSQIESWIARYNKSHKDTKNN